MPSDQSFKNSIDDPRVDEPAIWLSRQRNRRSEVPLSSDLRCMTLLGPRCWLTYHALVHVPPVTSSRAIYHVQPERMNVPGRWGRPRKSVQVEYRRFLAPSATCRPGTFTVGQATYRGTRVVKSLMTLE